MHPATNWAAFVAATNLFLTAYTCDAAPPASAPDAVIAPPERHVLRFGEAIAACGELVAACAPVDGDLGATAGAANVIRLGVRPDGSWSCEHVARLRSGREGDHFGCSAAMARRPSGEAVIAIGADWTSVREGFEGAVHVFTPIGDQLAAERATIVAPAVEAGAEFGHAVAIDGSASVLAIGAHREDSGSVFDAGAVHLYAANATASAEGGTADASDPRGPSWTHVQSLCAPSPEPSAWFGHSIAISEHWLAIGAPGASIGGVSGAGCVHVFARDHEGLFRPHAVFASPARASHAWFGQAIALDGSTLVVGEPRATNGGVRSGAAWICELDALDQPPRQLHAPGATLPSMSGIGFGQAVAIAPCAVLVGAPGFDEALRGHAVEDAGRSFVFARTRHATAPSLMLVDAAPSSSALLGASAALGWVPGRNGAPASAVALVGHLFVEEESAAPSPGVALYALDGLIPALEAPSRVDTTSRASASSP